MVWGLQGLLFWWGWSHGLCGSGCGRGLGWGIANAWYLLCGKESFVKMEGSLSFRATAVFIVLEKSVFLEKW